MASPDLVFHYADESPGWNTLVIATVGTGIGVVLNGIPVTSYDGASVLDDEVHRTRGVGLNGHLALQIHKGDQLRIRFTDIALKELPPGSDLPAGSENALPPLGNEALCGSCILCTRHSTAATRRERLGRKIPEFPWDILPITENPRSALWFVFQRLCQS